MLHRVGAIWFLAPPNQKLLPTPLIITIIIVVTTMSFLVILQYTLSAPPMLLLFGFKSQELDTAGLNTKLLPTQPTKPVYNIYGLELNIIVKSSCKIPLTGVKLW